MPFDLNPIYRDLMLVLLIFAASAAYAQKPDTRWYSAYPGAKNLPISNANELAGLALIVNGTWGGAPSRDDFSGKTVTLKKNIDLSRYDNWAPIGVYDSASGEFRLFAGTFDGSNRVISRSAKAARRPGADTLGLFGSVNGANVKNLKLNGVNIRGGSLVNGLPKHVWESANISTGEYRRKNSNPFGKTGVAQLALFVDDSVITPKVDGVFQPSITYREFHRYVTADGLDTLIEHAPGAQMPRLRTGRLLTARERLDVYLYATVPKTGSIITTPNGIPLSAYDEVMRCLVELKGRHGGSDMLILGSDSKVICDKALRLRDAAHSAGFAYVFMAFRLGATAPLPKAVRYEPGQDVDAVLVGVRGLKPAGNAAPQSPGRPRASIQKVVLDNMASLRHAYSKRLRDKPGVAGTIETKFSIDERGDVISARVLSSTMNDPEFEQLILDKVRAWKFEAINKPGDITEIVYPFTFTE